MAHQMKRFTFYPVLLTFLLSIGCGTSSDVAQQDTSDEAVAVAPEPPTPSPTDVVSQFLDQVRRGGADSNAGSFLTVKAQSELQRIGRKVQPIGSPDARFEVTRAESVPDTENSMLVQSIWSEPNPDGTTSQFPVVWAVELENQSWRISGLAMELQAGSNPVIIDFENGDRMAELLGEPNNTAATTPTGAQAPAQAAAPGTTTNR